MSDSNYNHTDYTYKTAKYLATHQLSTGIILTIVGIIFLIPSYHVGEATRVYPQVKLGVAAYNSSDCLFFQASCVL